MLQTTLGLGTKDMALLAGCLALILGIVLIGITGRRHRLRWVGRFAWVTLIGSFVMIGYGAIHRSPTVVQSDGPLS